MRLRLWPVLLVVCLAADAARAEGGLRPLRANGPRIVDDAGNTVLLRGVNLGGWLVVEPFFLLGPDSKFKDERGLWAGLEERFGRAKMEEIRDAFRGAWIDEEDFRRVKAMGLNSVRVPFWYALLEDDARPGEYAPSGWKWLDRAVDWCEATGIYCILDLHGAPGGQSSEGHTGEAGRNQLWRSFELQERTAQLWTAIAQRYRGRSAIAAFDLLNEPMGAPRKTALHALYGQLIAAVRAADPERLVIVEDAFCGVDTMPNPASRGWTGVIYSEHQYPTMGKSEPRPKVHERYLSRHYPDLEETQARFNVPIYIGEWSVIHASAGGGSMSARYVSEMESRGWSWALWLYKKTSTEAEPRVATSWSLFKNDRPLRIDFERGSADEILRELETLRTKNLSSDSSLSEAVRPKTIPNRVTFEFDPDQPLESGMPTELQIRRLPESGE